MSLISLPDELLLYIASFCSKCCHCALSRVNRRLHEVFDNELYRSYARRTSWILDWAARRGFVTTFQKALRAGVYLSLEYVEVMLAGVGPGDKPDVPLHGFIAQFTPPPLAIAVRGGHESLVRLILAQGGSPDLKEPSGRSMLAIAARGGHASVASGLLDAGATQVLEAWKPVVVAASWDRVDVAALLLSGLETCPDAIRSQHMQEALVSAVELGHEHVVRLLIDHGVRLEPSLAELSPLGLAAKKGHERLVALLLEKGVYPGVKSINNSSAPLAQAVTSRHADIVKILIKEMTPVDCTNVLIWAVSYMTASAVRQLLENGVRPEFDCPITTASSRDTWMQPLAHAVAQSKMDMVIALVDHGAVVNPECQHLPPFHGCNRNLFLAVEKGCGGIVQYLLEHGANPNLECRHPSLTEASSILCLACNRGEDDIVYSLLSHGADPNLADPDGRRPLFHAVVTGNDSIVRILLMNDANPNLASESDRLSWALCCIRLSGLAQDALVTAWQVHGSRESPTA